jgi:hypothetical protein
MSRTFVLVLIVVSVVAVFEGLALRKLRQEMGALRADVTERARALAVERFGLSPAEMVRAAAWLDEYYRAERGLQRPGGLCDSDRHDAQAVGVWLFGAYLGARIEGASEDDARLLVATEISRSDEWRTKHAGEPASVQPPG